MTAPDPAYLAAADAAGLLHDLDGRRYVAGELEDAGGQRQCLLEYCDPGLLREPALATLTDRLGKAFPAAATVLVRVPPDVEPPPPWRPYLTYLRHDGPPAPGPAAVRAGAGQREAVGGWVRRALDAGLTEQERPADAAALAQAATTLLDRPDRVSYVWPPDAPPVGHVTLLEDARDDLTGRAHVELFDLLVEPGEDAGAARAALERAAIAHAAGRGLPLLGHVVHPAAAAGRERAAAVVRGLLGRGWLADHAYWARPAPEESAP